MPAAQAVVSGRQLQPCAARCCGLREIGRVDDHDEGEHAVVDVAAEHDEPGLVEQHVRIGRAGVQVELELLRGGERVHLVMDPVAVRETDRRAGAHDADVRHVGLVDLVDDRGRMRWRRGCIERVEDHDHVPGGRACRRFRDDVHRAGRSGECRQQRAQHSRCSGEGHAAHHGWTAGAGCAAGATGSVSTTSRFIGASSRSSSLVAPVATWCSCRIVRSVPTMS